MAGRSDRQSRTAEQAAHEDHARHIAAFPLAIALLAGPGAITATLLLAGQTGGSPALLAALLVVIAIVIGIALIVFCLAVPIGRVIGTTGNLVLSRLLGIILAALAVQFVIDGMRTALLGEAHPPNATWYMIRPGMKVKRPAITRAPM
jgi:small neutral amino acid transporter SnatA (MarC family)